MQKLILIYILAFCLTKISGLSEEMQELIDSLHKTCVGETGTSEEHIINARKGEFSDAENFKCYIKCLFDQMGCITEDGKIDIEATIAIMPPEIADKATPTIRKCGVESGSNPCETSWLFHKCYYATDPEFDYGGGSRRRSPN